MENDRIRIMHLLKHGMRDNGSVHVAVDLACAQATAGDEVTFVSGPGSFRPVLEAAGVHVVETVELSSMRNAFRAMVQIHRLVRTTRTDVLHAHMMSSALMGRVVATLRRRSLVTTVHNSFDTHSWLMGVGDKVVAVSEAEKVALIGRRFPASKIRVVLNGVIGTMREAADDSVALVQPALVTLSGLHPRKGVDLVIRAFAATDAQTTWHLNIVGAGPQREELGLLVGELAISDRVHFQGSTRNAERTLKQAALFVTGSLADPCPLAVIEARIAGCAVIGTDAGGIPEILALGEAGKVVPVHSIEALTRAFDEILDSPDQLNEWRNRARTGSDYFSIGRMAQEYGVIYRELPRSTAAARSARAR